MWFRILVGSNIVCIGLWLHVSSTPAEPVVDIEDEDEMFRCTSDDGEFHRHIQQIPIEKLELFKVCGPGQSDSVVIHLDWLEMYEQCHCLTDSHRNVLFYNFSSSLTLRSVLRMLLLSIEYLKLVSRIPAMVSPWSHFMREGWHHTHRNILIPSSALSKPWVSCRAYNGILTFGLSESRHPRKDR